MCCCAAVCCAVCCAAVCCVLCAVYCRSALLCYVCCCGARAREYVQVLIPEGQEHCPVMIDFERAKQGDRPKNVTQFCEFVNLPTIRALLQAKQIHVSA